MGEDLYRYPEVLDTPYVTIRIENSIMVGVYKKGVTIDLEAAKQIAQYRINFLQGRSYPVFADIRHVKLVTKEASNYLSKDIGISGVKAGALLVGNPLTVFIANIYLKFVKPKIPTKVFITREAAMKWLGQFV